MNDSMSKRVEQIRTDHENRKNSCEGWYDEPYAQVANLLSAIDSLEKDNRDLKEESKNHWQDNQNTLKKFSESEDREMALEAKLKKAEDGLEYYAKPRGWTEDAYGDKKSYIDESIMAIEVLKEIRGEPSSE